MAAQDYVIQLGWMSAYLTKKKKKPSNTMSNDRRVIEESEIMMLVDWSLNNYLNERGKKEGGYGFESLQREGYEVQVKLVKKEKETEGEIKKEDKEKE